MASSWRSRAPLSVVARLLAITATISAVACCGDDDIPPPIDAGPGGTPTLDIGTGEDAYIAVDDGGMVELHRGCQGLQHIWVGLRTTRLGAMRNIIELSCVRVRDDFVASIPFTARLTLTPDATGATIAGLPLVIEDPGNVIGEEIVIRAHARDMSGVDVFATKPVRVVWGADICSVGDGGELDGMRDGDVPDGGVVDAPDAGEAFDGGV